MKVLLELVVNHCINYIVYTIYVYICAYVCLYKSTILENMIVVLVYHLVGIDIEASRIEIKLLANVCFK
jgi:hypothetical protein